MLGLRLVLGGPACLSPLGLLPHSANHLGPCTPTSTPSPHSPGLGSLRSPAPQRAPWGPCPTRGSDSAALPCKTPSPGFRNTDGGRGRGDVLSAEAPAAEASCTPRPGGRAGGQVWEGTRQGARRRAGRCPQALGSASGQCPPWSPPTSSAGGDAVRGKAPDQGPGRGESPSLQSLGLKPPGSQGAPELLPVVGNRTPGRGAATRPCRASGRGTRDAG